MATLVRPRLWGTQKPSVGAQIEWGHPLAQGLRACVLDNEQGGQPVDLVRNQGGASAVWTTTPDGLGTRAATWASRGGDVADATPLSVLCLYRQYSTGDFTEPWACYTYASESNNQGWNIQMRPSSVTGLCISTFNNNGVGGGTGGYCLQSSVNTEQTGSWVIGFTTDGANRNLFLNGKLDASDSAGGMAAPAAGTSLGAFGAPTRSGIAYGYVWRRVLTADEMAWLAVEPYAFLQPAGPKLLYFAFNSLTTDATVEPATLAATVAFPAPGVGAGVGATAMSVSATFPSPGIGAGVGATALAAAAAFGTPGITAGVGATAMSVSAAFPSPGIGAGIGANALDAIATFPAGSISAGVGANALTAAAAFNSAAISAGVGADVLAATVTIPTPTVDSIVLNAIRRRIRKVTGRGASSGRPSGERGRKETWWGE